MKKLLLVLLFVALAVPSFGATYYVDFQNGNDHNSGLSHSAAWKTIPGTCTGNGQTGYLNAAWGSITPSNQIQPGSTIYLRPGAQYISSVGGYISIRSGGSDFYSSAATASSPIVITPDATWGSGAVVFDAGSLNLTPNDTLGFITIEGANGVTIDGGTTGITIQNTGNSAIRVRAVAQALTPQQSDFVFNNLTFLGDGGNTDATSGVSEADINISDSQNVTITNCLSDGALSAGGVTNQDGFLIGDYNNKNFNVKVSNCISRNRSQDESVNDNHGLGFKTFNSQVTFFNCQSYNQNKGFDNSDHCYVDGCQNQPNMQVAVINSQAYGNVYGINMNYVGESQAPPAPGPIPAQFWIVNNLVYNNSGQGSNVYAGPYNIYIVGNVYDSNGGSNGAASMYESANLAIRNDYQSSPLVYDTYPVNAYVYNNIFYQPYGQQYFQGWWWINMSTFSWYSDYNCFVARNATDIFANWAGYSGSTPSEMMTFAYGQQQGPGWNTSLWYAYYGGSAATPTNACNGHYQDDAHSLGTGSSNPTTPAFVNYSAHNYQITGHLQGVNLSTMPWYIPAMGYDFNNYPRSSWDIGAFEVGSVPTSPSAAVMATSSSAAAADSPGGSSGSSGGGGGGCFIATAAYGSYLAPQVQALRHFRDRWLLTNRAGISLVACYYRWSPSAANYIGKHSLLRLGTRCALTPVVYSVEYPALPAFLFPALVVGLAARRRRRRKNIGDL